MANVGKYTIHGWYGIYDLKMSTSDPNTPKIYTSKIILSDFLLVFVGSHPMEKDFLIPFDLHLFLGTGPFNRKNSFHENSHLFNLESLGPVCNVPGTPAIHRSWHLSSEASSSGFCGWRAVPGTQQMEDVIFFLYKFWGMVIHPQSLRYKPENDWFFNRDLLFQGAIFRFHVKLQGCIGLQIEEDIIQEDVDHLQKGFPWLSGFKHVRDICHFGVVCLTSAVLRLGISAVFSTR